MKPSEIHVKGREEATETAKKLLYELSDSNTILFLSGGSTPEELYELFAREGTLKVGSVALVDERYGEKMHKDSNEKMIETTGLFKSLNTPIHKILKGKDIDTTSKDYEKTVSNLFGKYKKRIAILGIGADGHTAGIAPNRKDFKNPLFKNKTSFVGHFNDSKGNFKERITLTLKALRKMDKIIILVFGKEKKEALSLMFTKGKIEDIPARFFSQKDVALKTILITDQKV